MDLAFIKAVTRCYHVYTCPIPHYINYPILLPTMKLIKIENQFLNIDLLESVEIEADMIAISIAGQRYLFAGEEAAALHAWFDQYAFDLMGRQAVAAERKVNEQPSIERLHAQVRALGLFRKPFVLE